MSDPQQYTIGWISALGTESVAAQQFLDERHNSPENVAQHDNNVYTLGRVGRHNVVMAVLHMGMYGTTTAATAVTDMLHSFPNIRIGLMVGIGGGAPSPEHDIRLGDVVVSSREGNTGGVFQYNYGKTNQDQAFYHTGFLDQPPGVLRTAVSGLKMQYETNGHQLAAQIAQVLEKDPQLCMKYSRPSAASDRLYRPNAVHPPDSLNSCSKVCGNSPELLVTRAERDEEEGEPAIHYGLIASGNQVIKDAHVRDSFAAERGVLCFDMGAAGLMNYFPCLVIRGICDYSDSHTNKEWQGFSAMMAAAYAKDLLRQIPPDKVEAERPISAALKPIQEVSARVHQTANKTQGVMEKCLADLRLTDPRDDIRRIAEMKGGLFRGASDWILNSYDFRQWRDADHAQLLWIKGSPGKGKTMLMITIVKELERQHTSSSTALSYFFCQSTDENLNNATAVLRGLTYLLVKQQPSLISHVQEQYGPDGKPLFREVNAWVALSEILRNILHDPSLKNTYLIIDALDECKTGLPQLLKFISDNSWASPRVKWIVSSRNWAEIEQQLKLRDSAINLSLELTQNAPEFSSAVDAYIDHRISGLISLQDKHRAQVRDTLRQKANGTFLWAALVTQELQTANSWDILDVLDEVPEGLEGLYMRILDRARFPEPDQEFMAAMMMWIAECHPTGVPVFIVWAIQKFPHCLHHISQTADVDLLGLVPELKEFFLTPDHLARLRASIDSHSRGLIRLWGEGTWYTTAIAIHQSVCDWIRRPGTFQHFSSHSTFPDETSLLQALCYGYLVLIQADNRISTQDLGAGDERAGANSHTHCFRISLFFTVFFGLVMRLVGRCTWTHRPVVSHLLEAGSWTGKKLLDDARFKQHAELIKDLVADISVLLDQINIGEVLGRSTPDDNTIGVPSREEMSNSSVDIEYSDSASEVSFATSILSSASLASTASSIAESADISEQLVFILFRDDEMRTLYEEALKKLGPKIFTRSHGKLLRKYFRELKSRCEVGLHQRAIRALARRTQWRQVTELIAQLVRPNGRRDLDSLVADNEERKDRLNHLIISVSTDTHVVAVVEGRGTAEPADDESEGSEGEKVEENEEDTKDQPPIYEITKFLLGGPPFQALKCRLRYLARPPHNIPSALSQGRDTLLMYLESQFEQAAVGEYEWIRALEEVGYACDEIADLLFEERHDSPWIYFELNPSLAKLLTDIENTPQESLAESLEQRSLLPELELSTCGISVVRQLVEELCGLGGIAPDSRDTSQWNGEVRFTEENSRAIISYSSAVSGLNETKTVLARLLRVAQRLCLAAFVLRNAGCCADGFTFLAGPASETNQTPQVRLCRVDISLTIRLVELYKGLLHLDEDRVGASQELTQLRDLSKSVLCPIIPESRGSLWVMDPKSAWTALSVSSLAVQVLSIGLLSFSRAHTGNLQPFFIDSTLRNIVILGLEDICSSADSLCIGAGLVELTCLAGMTGGPVVVFYQSTPTGSTEPRGRFDVRATPDDVLDTWGPGAFVIPRKGTEDGPAVAIAIGGGYIVPAPLEDESGKYHWDQALRLPSAPPKLDATADIVIGAMISINDQCTSDEDICWRRSSPSTLELGTYQSYYETTEHQLGAQVGSDYGTVVVNRIRSKRPGTTLKDEILKSLIDFPATVFDYYCGVRISYCTGVAQRVPIAHLLGDLLSIFATTLTSADQKRSWRELESSYGVTEMFRGSESAWADPQSIRNWLEQLQADHHDCILRLIRLIVRTLAATGLSPDGSFFGIAWPRDNQVKNCLRVDFHDDDTKWIPMLADSEDCATFAYITNCCLPVEGEAPCRGPNPMWGSKVHLLETAVSFPTTLAARSLCHKQIYFFLKDGDDPAWFRATMGDGASHPTLVKLGTLSSIPPGVRRRAVIWEQKKKNERRIRERRLFGHLAEEVRIHSRFSSKP